MTLFTFKHFLKISLVYFIVSILCVVFMGIYYSFAHGLTSNYMTFMFLVPLLSGIIMVALLVLLKKDIRVTFNLYNAGVATLTFYLMIKGIFEMAETSSPFTPIYLFLGIGFYLASIVTFIVQMKKDKSKNQ